MLWRLVSFCVAHFFVVLDLPSDVVLSTTFAPRRPLSRTQRFPIARRNILECGLGLERSGYSRIAHRPRFRVGSSRQSRSKDIQFYSVITSHAAPPFQKQHHPGRLRRPLRAPGPPAGQLRQDHAAQSESAQVQVSEPSRSESHWQYDDEVHWPGPAALRLVPPA